MLHVLGCCLFCTFLLVERSNWWAWLVGSSNTFPRSTGQSTQVPEKGWCLCWIWITNKYWMCLVYQSSALDKGQHCNVSSWTWCSYPLGLLWPEMFFLLRTKRWGLFNRILMILECNFSLSNWLCWLWEWLYFFIALSNSYLWIIRLVSVSDGLISVSAIVLESRSLISNQPCNLQYILSSILGIDESKSGH